MSGTLPTQRVQDLVDALGFRASANPATMTADTLRALATILAMNGRASITLQDLLRMAETADELNRRPFDIANAPLRGARDLGSYLVEVEAPARFWGSVPADSAADAVRRVVSMIATEQRDDLAVTFGRPTFTAAEKTGSAVAAGSQPRGEK